MVHASNSTGEGELALHLFISVNNDFKQQKNHSKFTSCLLGHIFNEILDSVTNICSLLIVFLSSLHRVSRLPI